MPDPRTVSGPAPGANPPAMPKVIVQFGGEEWTVELREGVNVAGRSPQATIPIRDASMSREHCEIVLEGGLATVVDRGSMNGTLVNGTRMDRKVLAPGDKIQIGKASMYYEEKQASAAPSAAGKKAPEPVMGIDDFSFWRRESGGWFWSAAGLAVLALLAVGAVFMFRSFGRGERVAVDPGNLLGSSGWFEPGPERAVVGWAMKPGLASRIQAVEGAAKQGKTCLQLEKSGAAGDLIAEVALQEVLAVSSPAPLEVTAWVRSESPGILPALKVTWLAARSGPLLVEESSEPAPGSSDWTQLTRSFAPPPGAAFLQLSLIAAGRAGRVFFDDVRARFGSGAGSPPAATLGAHSVTATPVGALVIGQDTRRIVNNLQIFLASDKEGTNHQYAATGGRVEANPDSKKLTASGKLASPVDLRPVEFEIEARAAAKEGLLLGYSLRGDALKQVDRLGLTLLLPGSELKGDYTNPVPRVWFRSGAAGDFILEISDGLMRVTKDWVPGAQRIVLGVPIPKGVSELAFSFLLKPGAGAQTDPFTAGEKAVAEGRMSDAVTIFNDLLAATREEQKRNDIRAKLTQLGESETADWQAVQAQGFKAELVGLKPYFEEAIQNLDRYEKRWPAGKRAEAAKAERAKLAAGLAAAAEDRETLRAHRLVDRAEEHRKEGRTLLARELCETVRRHYSAQASAVARAADLLKKLGTE